MSGPLEGIRVLDMTWALAGPYCTMILCDLGADVIKIENPEGGDSSRRNFPFIDGVSSYFLSVNRGKKSVTVNLQDKKGKEIIFALAARSGVLVENFRPGVMNRLGLGYEAIRKINPKIIFASCSGFGQESPYAHRPAYDVIVQGMAGTLSITGESNGPPVRVGFSIGDIGGGLFTAIGILSALHERERSGMGQMIDIAMLDCQIALLENAFARFLSSGDVPTRIGTRHPIITPFQAFPTKDGHVVFAVTRESWWQRFCQMINRPDLILDERFKNNPSRNTNHKELEAIITEIMRTRTTSEWVIAMDKIDIACGPVNTINQMASDPHTQTREMIVDVKHSKVKNMKVVNSPIKLSRTPVKVEKASPDLGEDTDEILANLLGFNAKEIADLRSKKVV